MATSLHKSLAGQTDRQWQTDRQTDRQTDSQWQTDNGRQTMVDRQTDRQTDNGRQWQTDRQTDRTTFVLHKMSSNGQYFYTNSTSEIIIPFLVMCRTGRVLD